MLSFLLSLSLAAAAPAPVAPAQASAVLFLRSAKQSLPDLRAFLGRAGALAPALSPEALGRSLGGDLGVDLLDVAALEAAGVDVAAPLTASLQGEVSLVCLAGGRAAVERLEQALARTGAVARASYRGARLAGAVVGRAWRGGYAARGAQLCYASGGEVGPALRAAVDAMGGGGLAADRAWLAASQGLGGASLGFARSGGLAAAFALRASAAGLSVRGRWLGPPLLGRPLQRSALAGLAAEAPVVATAELAPAALAEPPQGPVANLLVALAASACPRCRPGAGRALWEAVRPQLAGSVGLVVAGVDPSAAGEPGGDYFLWRHVYLAPLKDEAGGVAALKAGVERLRVAGARVGEEAVPGGGCHFALSWNGRAILVGVGAGALYLASDAGARDLGLAALAKAAPAEPSHAARLALDGPRVVAALQRISLLDVGRSPALGLLFAASVEAGALLKAAGTVAGSADPDPRGGAFEVEIKLAP